MSNKLKVILFIFAGVVLVGVGIFASYYLFQRLQAQPEPEVVEEEPIKTDVVVLTRAISLGAALKPGDLEVISVPVEIAPPNVITDPDEAVGKIVKTDLVQGEMLLLHNLADPTNNNGDLSFILSDDHVLMAFPADDLMSQESVPQRGDIVDIFASFEQEVETIGEPVTAEGEPEEPQTRTFTLDTLQKVEVTALVLDMIEQEETSPTLLGEGTPEE